MRPPNQYDQNNRGSHSDCAEEEALSSTCVVQETESGTFVPPVDDIKHREPWLAGAIRECSDHRSFAYDVHQEYGCGGKEGTGNARIKSLAYRHWTLSLSL